MSEDDFATLAAADLKPLLDLWRVGQREMQQLQELAPVLIKALDGSESEIFESFILRRVGADDPQQSAAGIAEAKDLANFWRTLLSGTMGEQSLRRAADLGREHLQLGAGGRYFLAATQQVLRRLTRSLTALPLAARDQTLDVVTRTVLMAADMALTAYYDSVMDLVSEVEVRRRTGHFFAEMKTLEQLAHVDQLTKLFNRRHFDHALEREIARSNRYETALCLVIIDLDHFKKINDTHGHATGDLVLCAAADIMLNAARRTDILARYGGEEFALILPDTPLEKAQLVAERMRHSLEERVIDSSGGTAQVKVTLSAGISQFILGEQPLTLIERTDLALYRAKGAGRNQVGV